MSDGERTEPAPAEPRRSAAWALLLALDFMVAASVCEIWVRALVPVKRVCWTFDEALGPHRCANQRRTGYVEPGYSSTLITNSLGFHDREPSRQADRGVYRIQVYGDSMIVGQNVAIEETIPAVAERRLDQLAAADRFEVMNLASVDSTTSQILVHEKFGRGLQPDLVVAFFMDDFPDNLLEVHGRPTLPHHRLEPDGRLTLVAPRTKDLGHPWERFKRGSHLYRALANKLLESRLYHDLRRLTAELRRPPAEPRGSRGGDPLDGRRRALVERGWPLTLRLIEEFRRQAEADGARFVLVDGSLFDEVNVGSVFRNEDLERWCGERGIAYLRMWDVLEEMKAAADGRRLFFRDHHPTPAGNEILGSTLADRLWELLSAEEATPRDV